MSRRVENARMLNWKHGLYKHPLYNTWLNMVQRCTDPTRQNYPRYGGRGVTVCERWMDVANFIADMGERPAGFTLERIDNAKGYSPENCKWASTKEQALNKRQAHHLTLNGRTQTIREWADELHIKYSTLACRVDLYGWSDEKALTTPVAKRSSNRQVVG